MTFRPDPKPAKPVLLKGKAYTKLRFDTWVKAGGRCETCGKWVPLLDPSGVFDVFTCAHLSHIIPRKRGGDIPENVKNECFDCHIAQGHLKWRSDKKGAKP